jgi:hypothetical protein
LERLILGGKDDTAFGSDGLEYLGLPIWETFTVEAGSTRRNMIGNMVGELLNEIARLREKIEQMQDADTNPYILGGDELARADQRAKQR